MIFLCLIFVWNGDRFPDYQLRSHRAVFGVTVTNALKDHFRSTFSKCDGILTDGGEGRHEELSNGYIVKADDRKLLRNAYAEVVCGS